MAEVREQRQRQRAEGREQRRARAEEPVESPVGPQLKRAAATAAAAALAGALAGGAKALADKRGRPQSRPEPEDELDEEHEPEPQEDPAPTAETETAATAGQDEQHAVEAQPETGDEQPEHGAETGEVAEVIERAREHVQEVLGSEAESVSGIERSNGHWCVTVEVVQLRRIPESTDVLASYAVLVDDEGGLISLQQTRRYRRSQADDGR